MARSRLLYIDIVKGIGIIIVVCSHTEAHDLMMWAVGFFVPIFYFCSGYMTTYPLTNDSITQKLKKRARKLLIPYLFFNSLLLLYYRHWSISGLYGVIYSRYSFFPLESDNNYELFIWGNYPMWFITSLLISYYLYYILLYNKNRGIIIFIYLCITYVLSKLPILLPWSIDTAFLSSLIMYAGFYSNTHDLISCGKSEILICVLVYSLLLNVAGDINLSVRQYGTSFIIYYIIAILGCVVVLWSSKRIERTLIGKLLAIFGKHSLTIFCIEILFIRETSIAYCKILNTDEVGILGGICGIVIALFGGTILSILLHKNNFLRRWMYGETNVVPNKKSSNTNGQKSNILLLIILLIVFSLIFIGSVLRDYYSLAKDCVLNPSSSITTLNNDTITVIFIGDSWAAYHSKYDQHLKTCIERKINKPTKVISRGIVGAKTKTIYTEMHAAPPYGTKDLIEASPDYAILSAGINDAVAKIGTANYCHHYNLIIKELISAGIKPIIIDMPQVDYRAVYQRESITAKIRHHISSWITEAPLWSFDNYRTALQSLIKQDKMAKRLIYIPASDWNPEGYKDSRHLYFEDHVHLNDKGYYLLDSCITSIIYHDMMPTHDSQ